VKMVPCPRCGTLAPFKPGNKWRPFCSERCKIIDLGEWAAESYRMPAEEASDSSDKEGEGEET
jgi:uncharacterized protein